MLRPTLPCAKIASTGTRSPAPRPNADPHTSASPFSPVEPEPLQVFFEVAEAEEANDVGFADELRCSPERQVIAPATLVHDLDRVPDRDRDPSEFVGWGRLVRPGVFPPHVR